MIKIKFTNRLNQSGLSLVEVVASIVILSIILLSFFTMLVQSAKTTKTSEEIIDATYIAQTEIEELYAYSAKNPFPIGNFEANIFPNFHFIKSKNENGIEEYYYEKQESAYIILKVTPKTIASTNLTRVLIQIYDKKNGTMKAQMENTLEWGT
ncbi:prepilin-type N-terminal cleavage/methylation domain-containing protein [Lysinibacillus yapensis]|uniref:Prepilin-type N-terminal cleavage/methylation domain-containing protein n=1 Tax=Ureibacillus yapensis TaxID=2304605 RepID=A0A396SSR0_9BACL|nr:prepilin-type N-terminal cleavage/methylation domain-containing protein [Lysinibacillus yapensis]RHW39491.1 prepilin-type N-terminal cleavage/methylation domain-containing protein [Lysinibacillus yapensis]